MSWTQSETSAIAISVRRYELVVRHKETPSVKGILTCSSQVYPKHQQYIVNTARLHSSSATNMQPVQADKTVFDRDPAPLGSPDDLEAEACYYSDKYMSPLFGHCLPFAALASFGGVTLSQVPRRVQA